MPLSETFWVSFVTIGAGLITAALGVCYKSKCSEMDFFCIKIRRDVASEVKEDLAGVSGTNSSGQ
jgi:hypothetical protein